MIFLIDQPLPRRLAAWLAAQGHTAHHVRDIGLEHAEDLAIWRGARALGATIVTKDEDFTALGRLDPSVAVVWLRFGNCSNDELLQRLAALWPRVIEELANGAPLVELR